MSHSLLRRFRLLDQKVEILVDDGDDSGVTVVEAGDLGIVTTASDVYDTSLAADNGCDPQGCTAALTRVGLIASSVFPVRASRANQGRVTVFCCA